MRSLRIFFCLLVLFTVPLVVFAQNALPHDKGEPVIVNHDTILVYYTNMGFLSARERAGVVTRRMERLINRLDFTSDSLALRNDSNVSIITYKSQVVLTVTDKDASFTELSRQQLAASYLSILKTRLGDLFETNSTKSLVKRILEGISSRRGIPPAYLGGDPLFQGCQGKK